MPISKDLSVSPYFDDSNSDKNFYKVLFKPSVAVQVRELNQLQTLLQSQVEKFGNNIYKRGTIIDGCNFVYYPNYAYVKINDAQLDSLPATPSAYVGSFIVDPSSNLVAHIINSQDGFETTDPDLKTLYLRYINSGNSGNATAFSAGSTLKIYDYLDSVNKIIINNGSSGWSNNDTLVFCSALNVNVSTNTAFTVGETITQSGNAHNAIITDIITYNGQTVLKVKPRTSDLSNTAIASTAWQFDNGAGIIGSSSGATATINSSIGNNAVGLITTSADVGKILKIDITNPGAGYYVEPYVSVKSSGTATAIGTRDYNNLNVVAQNYIAQVTVSSRSNSVGLGYAFGITSGVIYQKGYFVGVDPQTVIVSKYSPSPDGVSVGFQTNESIIDSNIDQSLLDNALGEPNEFAPGADRLQLTPTLVVSNTSVAEANDQFLTLAEFSQGSPFIENRRTQFNSIEDEMALRTKEADGNFVLNPFLVTTTSTANAAAEGSTFSVVVDPGRGYIDGYRVETISNYFTDVDKGIDTKNAVNLATTINYGNYVLVTEVAGTWNCNIGTTINLKDAASTGVSNTAAVSSGTVNSNGNTIGTARVRNLVYDSGEAGTNGAVYRLYLFNIQMLAGQSFRSVRGVQIGSTSGVADIVLTFDATTNANVCVLNDTQSGSSLLVDSGSTATGNITNLNYVYRGTNETLSLANTGTTSLLLTDPSETFAYDSVSLPSNELKTLTLVPTSGDIVFTPNTGADGTAAVTSGSNTITINSATVNKYSIGDFVALYSNTSAYILRRVTNKTSTQLQLDSTASFSNATATFSHAYPKNVPVGLARISTATATLTGGNKTININLGQTVNSGSAITCALTYDVQVTTATPQAKTPTRDIFVKLNIFNSDATGPWCLGIPDIFRLKKVFYYVDSSVNTNSTDVTSQFYIDHNQTSDYYGLGYLYQRTGSTLSLGGSSWLLVQFDAFTSTPGVFTLNSYVSSNTAQRLSDDGIALGSLGSKTNSFEVPEMYTQNGQYFDLLNSIDFRPVATATASYSLSVAGASVNPSSTLSFSGSSKKFPLPKSGVQYDRTSFLGRKDNVVITKDNVIKVIRGTPSDAPVAPPVPAGVLFLNTIDVPPYPCVATKFSAPMTAILDKKMASENKLLLTRIQDKTISVEVDDNLRKIDQPRGYTMADIGELDRRITDLEYYVSLNQVQTDLKNTVIPSAVSPGLDRFKFGFFADDYSTTQYSDTTHIEYRCDVVDSKVVPLSMSVGTPHGPDGPSTGPCVGDIVLVNQNQATTVANTVAPPPGPPPPVAAKMVTLYRSENTTGHALTSNTGWLQFSSVPSTFKIDYNFFSKPDGLVVQKRNANLAVTVLYSNTSLSGSGTLNFNHDPSTGREYMLITTYSSELWEYTLTYPVDDTVYVAPTAPSPNVFTNFYDGVLVGVSPGTLNSQARTEDFGETAFISVGVVQTISLAGLKPSTVHTVSLGDTTTSLTVFPLVVSPTVGGASTSTVTTDASGKVQFQMRINNAVVSSLDALTGHTVTNQVPGTMYVSVNSADNTSVASFVTKIDTTRIKDYDLADLWHSPGARGSQSRLLASGSN